MINFKYGQVSYPINNDYIIYFIEEKIKNNEKISDFKEKLKLYVDEEYIDDIILELNFYDSNIKYKTYVCMPRPCDCDNDDKISKIGLSIIPEDLSKDKTKVPYLLCYISEE